MKAAPAPRPFVFFGVLFALSVPFWLYGALHGAELLPGLPVSAAMALCPALAAGVLVYYEGNRAALGAFLRRSVDLRRMPLWAWLVAVGTMPAVMAGSAALQWAMGVDLPAPQIGLTQTLALFALFFVAATTEELGWSAYASRPLARAYGLGLAALILGTVSVVWHVIPLIQAGRSAEWIAWWALGSMARRIIILWLYLRGGESVFATSLFHAMSNLSWMLFPVMGSHYDPVTTAGLLWLIAVPVLIFGAGARTSMRSWP
ncbi:MAG: CPBP family glutamic-type intramembrane protease [Pseudomonadota bacterium]